ncbi:MAG: S8 family serine peptidase [Alphaproteobacteria bacterium]|nr:S8 family serine peptidase [Alphaproteobacteria bacterium]MCB9795092.1 S8 family serine peptidase [Alphaproteobacteria bacterium]
MLLLLSLFAHAAPPSELLAGASVAVHPELVEAWALASERGDGGAPLIVVLELESAEAGDGALAALRAQAPEATLQARSGALLQVSLPAHRALALAALPGVLRARPPWRATPKEVISEGAEALFVDYDWWAEGVTGQDITVGVLDVGFSGLDRLDEDERPARIEWVGEVGSSTHGANVVEVIHDVAPDAGVRLYTFSTDVEFLEVLDAAVLDGVDVINASIGFDNVWHADGTSPMSAGVDAAARAGVVYVAAAGNEVGRYRIGELRDADGDGIVEIDGAPEVVLARGTQVAASLRWSEPFGEAAVDLDLELVDDDGVCDAGRDTQDGAGLPYEAARCVSPTGVTRARIRLSSGDPEGLTAWIYAPSGLGSAEPEARSGTLTLPADAEGAIAVGALDLSTGELLDYSSQGPTDDGRLKPELVAAGEVSTASAGRLSFQGSSAATPHVTGLAALIVDRRPRARPETVRELLTDYAEDLGEPGWDNEFGAGAAQAGPLPGACGCATGGRSGAPWLPAAIAAAVGLLRRRSRILARPPGILYTSASPRG